MKETIKVAKAELGVKRRCLNCETPFFDLNRSPIVCPKCAALFHVVVIARSPPRRPSIRWDDPKRPAPVDPVIADLVLPMDEETAEDNAFHAD